MNGLLSAGVFILACVAGHWAIGCALAPRLRRSLLARHALALVLGIALLTPPLVLLAATGLFRVSWLGAFGWIAAIGTIPSLVARNKRWGLRAQLDSFDLFALAAAIIFTVIAAAGRDETLGAGRDQQVYAEEAVALSERGTASATYGPLDAADLALLRNISGTQIPDVTDKHAGVDLPIKLRHPLGWPVWLALAHAMFGIEGLYAANSLVFALGGLLFFLLLRCFVPPAMAAAATLLLYALPSSLWIAGISLSEPIAMTLLLAVPLFGASGASQSRWRIAAILVAATLIRIDAVLAVPSAMAAVLLAKSTSSVNCRLTAVRRFVLIQLFGLVAVLIAYRAMFPDYLYRNFGRLAIVVAASLVLTTTAFFLSSRIETSLRRLINLPASRVSAIGLLVLLFACAVEIRPSLQPFSVIPETSALAGMRDFRENSVLNLAVYLSWPILLASLGGVCYALWKRWPTRSGLLRPLVLVLGLGPALLYLWFPEVSPDHPWAFRRFLPTVVPYSLLFAAVFVHALSRRIGPSGGAIGPLFLVAPYSLIVAAYPLQRPLMRENDGITRQIESIARELPNELIVSVGVKENIAASLLMAYGKPVVFINRDMADPSDVAEVGKWIEAKSRRGRPAWLLYGQNLSKMGADLEQLRTWQLTSRYVVPSNQPPAIEVGEQTWHLTLCRVDRIQPSFETRMFGGERRWDAAESGFLSGEVGEFGSFRRIDGFAWIDVPSARLRDSEAIKVDIVYLGEKDESRRFHILINNVPVWSGNVTADLRTLRVPVLKPIVGDFARITLVSGAAAPARKVAADASAPRDIGLIGIRLLGAGERTSNEPTMRGFRSSLLFSQSLSLPLQVSTKGTTEFLVDVGNAGTAYWPTVRELGSYVGAVQIGIRWYRRDKSNTMVGDNRWPLFVSLLSGDHTIVRVPLVPTALDQKPLPPGEYEVRIGMARETVAMFADNGDAILSMPVVVTP